MDKVVVCSAMRHRETGRIICGVRHYDPIMRDQMEASEGVKFWKGCEQGFVDNQGSFLTRKEALSIARKQKQIVRNCGGSGSQLYSENIY